MSNNMKELRELPIDQLKSLIDDINKDLFELREQLAVNKKLQKPHLLRDKKKDRARAILALSEKMNKKDGI